MPPKEDLLAPSSWSDCGTLGSCGLSLVRGLAFLCWPASFSVFVSQCCPVFLLGSWLIRIKAGLASASIVERLGR